MVYDAKVARIVEELVDAIRSSIESVVPSQGCDNKRSSAAKSLSVPSAEIAKLIDVANEAVAWRFADQELDIETGTIFSRLEAAIKQAQRSIAVPEKDSKVPSAGGTFRICGEQTRMTTNETFE